MNDKIAVGEAGKDFQKLARTVLETPEPAAKKAAAKVKETAEKVWPDGWGRAPVLECAPSMGTLRHQAQSHCCPPLRA